MNSGFSSSCSVSINPAEGPVGAGDAVAGVLVSFPLGFATGVPPLVDCVPFNRWAGIEVG